MQIRAPLSVEIYANRLHCGSKCPELYTPIYTLGSLEGDQLELAIVDRLEKIYADHDPGKSSFYHGIWCEAHMPLLLAVKNKTVRNMQDVYLKKLQPEVANIKSIIGPQAISVLYNTEMSGALCGNSHLRGKSLVCSKLIEKCLSINGNHTESVRYIRAQFTKANECNPGGLAYQLAGCILLGLIPGTTLAPPKNRILFHTQPDAEIARLIEQLPSRSLWFALITVVTEVCKLDPIFRKTRAKGGFAPQFDTDLLSLSKLNVVKSSLIPALQGDPDKSLTPPEIKKKGTKRKLQVFPEFFPGVKHKRRLTENTVKTIFEIKCENSKKKLSKIYRSLLEHAPRCNFVDEKLLEDLGINNEHGRLVYEHAMEQRKTLACIPAHHASDSAPVPAIFCLQCFTLRTRVRGAPSNKATEATVLMMDGTHTCAACRNPRCLVVDIKNVYITTLLRHIDTVPAVIKTCSCCGFLSVLSNIVGDQGVCSHCFEKYDDHAKSVKQCCVCSKVLSKRSHYMPILAIDNDLGQPRVDHVCVACKGLQSAQGKPWNLSILKKLHRAREPR